MVVKKVGVSGHSEPSDESVATPLSVGTVLVVDAKSSEADTVDGLTDDWYHYKAGRQNGWIFGALVDILP